LEKLNGLLETLIQSLKPANFVNLSNPFQFLTSPTFLTLPTFLTFYNQ